MFDVIDYSFKDRKPKDTIDIIQRFFKDRGLEVRLIKDDPSEAGTYGCHLQLYYKDTFLIYSNGKGATRELGLASGYGELYERFCNKMKIFTQKNTYKKYKEINKQINGYAIHPEEKIMTYEEVCEDNLINTYFNTFVGYDEQRKERLMRLLSNNEFIGLPYKNLISAEKKYFDPQFLLRYMDSTGMCAGNSFEEAFNEGFSEILERFTYFDLTSSVGLDSYKVIDIEKLESENLKEKIHKIQKRGYEFFLVDLSYEYNLPVVVGILLDKRNHFTRINFGCFPVFEIAAMRTITEMYQNITSFLEDDDLIQTPAENEFNPSRFFSSHGSGLSSAAYFPPYFYKNKEMVETYNKDIFLEPDSNPKQVFNYYISLIVHENLNVWYIINSLTPEVISMHIYVDNLKASPFLEDIVDHATMNYNDFFEKIEIINKYEHLIYNENIDYSQIDYKEYSKLTYGKAEDDEWQIAIYSDTVYPLSTSHWLLPVTCQDAQKEVLDKTARPFAFTDLMPSAKKYLTARRYKDFGYSYKELVDVLEFLGVYDFTEEDYNNLDNVNYLLRKMVIEPSWLFYRSKEFEDIIKACIK